MSDSYTEVTHQSWIGRIFGSVIGALFGGVLVLLMIGGLWWNEGNAVAVYKSLKEGKGTAVSIVADTVKQSNEGKLVHLTGMASSKETLFDQQFRFISATNSLKLERQVEMYQWKENKSSRKEKTSGGGTRTVTTYSYNKTWSRTLINSSRFNRSGHNNPGSMPFKQQVVRAKKPTVGAFSIIESLVDKMNNKQAITPLNTMAIRGFQVHKGELYKGTNPSSPAIGDIRISFQALMPHEATIVAKQSGNRLETYLTSNGRTLELVEKGRVNLEDMFKRAANRQSKLTWIIRFAGSFIMFIAFCMILKPISTFLDVIPLIGSMMGSIAELGTILFSLIMAFGVSSLVIATAWIFYRPLISIPLLACAIALGLLPKFLKKSPSTAAPSVNSRAELPPALESPGNRPPLPAPWQKEPLQAEHLPVTGELSHLNPELICILELCTLYLVALDEEFSPIEQTWVDEKFGPGSADRFINQMPAMDWENCFNDIYNQLLGLNPTDQFYMKTQASVLFQDLMESDGLEGIEQDRLIGLMRFIRESLEKA